MRCIPGLKFRQGAVRFHPGLSGDLSCGNLLHRSEVLPLMQGVRLQGMRRHGSAAIACSASS